MKALPLIAFLLVAAAQWAAPLMGVAHYEKVLSTGTLIKLRCTAPDPYDPLRGRYLAVRPSVTRVPTGDTPPSGIGYVILETDKEGFATPVKWQTTAPESGLYVRAQSRWSGHFDWPFDRYYLNEKLAPEADVWFAENIRSAKGITAEVRLLDGTALLEDLSVDGKAMREMLADRLAGKP
jgi:uncharacterized membrane-anchored protein